MSTLTPAICPLIGFCNTVREKYSKFVDWTSANTVDLKTRLAVVDTDSTVKKVAKVFFTLIGSILLTLPSVAVSAFSWVKGKICKPEAAANQPTAPPATSAAPEPRAV